MVEAGRDCRDVVTQLSAVSSALDKAGFSIIATAMKECMADDALDAEGKPNVEDLEKTLPVALLTPLSTDHGP